MSSNFTQDQIQKLKNIGISVPNNSSPPQPPPSKDKEKNDLPPQSLSGTQPNTMPPRSKSSFLPLLSISGLSLLSIGGLVLFKNKTDSSALLSPNANPSSQQQEIPTPDPSLPAGRQVPKSIQHYLLASQQYFSQALQIQQSNSATDQVAQLLNQSLISASDAIKEYPSDYRGYEQRGRVYQSLIDSKPELLSLALQDLEAASRLNRTSPEITKSIATLYAKKGDVQNTLSYLSQTVAREPTKAQNFYDLAKLQQQAGLLSDAINTYTQLITILPDPTQKQQVETEKIALQNLLSQDKSGRTPTTIDINNPTLPQNPEPNSKPAEGPLLQADNNTGLIIASPQESKNITVTGQTSSNALSGTGSIASNQVSFTLTNSNITENSQIYVTLISGGKNQTLKVLSKSLGSCNIGFDTPIPENIEFTWWIIN